MNDYYLEANLLIKFIDYYYRPNKLIINGNIIRFLMKNRLSSRLIEITDKRCG